MAVISEKLDFTVYKSRRVPRSQNKQTPLTTHRINFKISECHHRSCMDLITIFSAGNGILKNKVPRLYWSFNLFRWNDLGVTPCYIQASVENIYIDCLFSSGTQTVKLNMDWVIIPLDYFSQELFSLLILWRCGVSLPCGVIAQGAKQQVIPKYRIRSYFDNPCQRAARTLRDHSFLQGSFN